MADIAASMAPAFRREPAGAQEATRRARAFAAAKRHSALVRFLRVAIFGGTLGTVVMLVGIALFDPFGRLAGGISVGSIGVEGTKVTMAHLKLSGFRKDGHPFLVNAQEAVQDALHPTLVELHRIDGDIGLPDGGMAHMTADSGFYDTAKEHMDVKDNVRVKSTQYDIWLKSAGVDFNGGHFASKEAVKIVTSSGMTMLGDAISASDNGKELVIEGNVKTTIPPGGAAADTQAQLKGAAP